MKLCMNCKHEDIDPENKPCLGCLGNSEKPNWVEKICILDTRVKAIELINTERERQDQKWGEQNHAPEKWTGILGEEYGEYCQAVNETVVNLGDKGGYENMMTELTHVAAVAVNAMEALMRARERGEI